MYIPPVVKVIFTILAISLMIVSWVIIFKKPIPSDNLTELEEKKANWRIVSYVCYAVLAVVVGPEIYYYIKNGHLSF